MHCFFRAIGKTAPFRPVNHNGCYNNLRDDGSDDGAVLTNQAWRIHQTLNS